MADEKKVTGGTKLRRCKCEHKVQDQIHGYKMRVHNVGAKGDRCTVCSDLKTMSDR